MTEPWLSGPIPGVSPLLSPLLYSFQQAREDLAAHTAGLTADRIWNGFPAAIGFHLRHIAGSTGRLMQYLQDQSLTAAQMDALEAEKTPSGAGREALLAEIDRAFREAEAVVRRIDPGDFGGFPDGGPPATADHRDRPSHPHRRAHAAPCRRGDCACSQSAGGRIAR